MKRRDRLTAEEVITKLKDDGDFDTLRLKFIRKVKDNEDLRNSIVMEVKQSVILDEEGSENLKLRQLSDAVYQELGSKIMGRISDEVWKVIRFDDSANDIKETVKTVYNRLVNAEEENDHVRSSPSKEQPVTRKEDDASPVTVSACEANMVDVGEPAEPPGFARCDQQTSSSSSSKVEHTELVKEQSPCLPSNEEIHCPSDPESQFADAMPPGFGPGSHGGELQGGVSEDDPDLPPGFG